MLNAVLPMPIQVVIDDCGWWSGHDGHAHNEPYRTGIARNHVPGDYAAIASLGRQLHMRPQAAMILCEWDRHNILAGLPSATWMGHRWDNGRWVGPWMEEAADLLRREARHIEIALHGIGHEYWSEDGHFERAEWCDRAGVMRPRGQVMAHLDMWARLLAEHNLGPFPESYAPTAFAHAFGEEDGLTAILQSRGIRCISTPFARMRQARPVEHRLFGFDGRVMTIDRMADPLDWHVIGTPPSRALAGPVCGLHWPNLLHIDPERNDEVVGHWVAYLLAYDRQPQTMLSADTRCWRTQLAHHVCTVVKVDGDSVELDFAGFERLPRGDLGDELTVHLQVDRPLASPMDPAVRAWGVTLLGVERIDTVDARWYRLALRRPAGIRGGRITVG